jgi:hypothetical protein
MSTDTERVAELAEDVFQRLATLIATSLDHGDALLCVFEPGDATQYQIALSTRNGYIVSVHTGMSRHLTRIDEVAVTFGTETQRVSLPWGHASRLDRELTHGWTAAVWRRLYPMIVERLVTR